MEGESSGRSGGGGIHRTSRLKTPQGIVAAYRESQMRKAAGYEHVDSNQQSSNGYAERRGMVQLQNEVRQYDDSERSSSSSFGDGESVVPPVKLGPIKPKGKSSIRYDFIIIEQHHCTFYFEHVYTCIHKRNLF